jgi:hypothetical protein
MIIATPQMARTREALPFPELLFIDISVMLTNF